MHAISMSYPHQKYAMVHAMNALQNAKKHALKKKKTSNISGN